jgi:flagellar basal body-associated protein FliL
MQEQSNSLDSKDSSTQEDSRKAPGQSSSWIKVGAVAAVSALAGGLAAAWFYRKTLRRMHAAESDPEDSNFRTAETPEDEI